ncbi:MAG: hypothetical protein ACAH95_03070 [Fimbriimonas sp.]
MARLAVPRRSRAFGALAVAAVLIGPALLWRKASSEAKTESVSNFKLAFTMPEGWIERPHSPQTLFLYMDPKTRVSMRGAASQVVADENPTPDLDRDTLTNQFARVTIDNLGWKAEILGTVDCEGGSYRLIRRETGDRTIVSGIAVRGNTTIIITLAGIGKAKPHIDAQIPHFRDYLASTTLTKSIMY